MARRLAMLTAEIESVRRSAGGDPPPADTGPVPEPPGQAVAAGEAVSVPRPGRHAASRPGSGLLDRWRTTVGPPQLTVLAVAVSLGLAVTAWIVVRGNAEELPLPPAPASASGEPAEAASPSPLVSLPPATDGPGPVGTDPEGELVVDVAGKVRRPGIAVLPAGSRVVDALQAAGGARRGVDLTPLNLARVLVDGEQILVGVSTPSGVGAAAMPSGPPGAPQPLVNVNTADQATLETLPGIGPVTAQAIIGWRQAHGGFTAVEELLEVDGIGEATLGRLAPLVTV